jgi:hypothetical protein
MVQFAPEMETRGLFAALNDSINVPLADPTLNCTIPVPRAMGSLKVRTTLATEDIPLAPSAGLKVETVGGAVSTGIATAFHCVEKGIAR